MLELIDHDCKAYADDTKIIAIIKNFLSNLKLQGDMDKICNSLKNWSTVLNADKCKVLHLGRTNSKFEYEIVSQSGERQPLAKSSCEKDLGIFIKQDMKWDVQVRHCTAKANRMLAMIRKSFKFLNKHNTTLLYKSLVRPHLEYAISSWSPYCKFEKVNLVNDTYLIT